MPALAELLKGKVADSLKALAAPAGLVPAVLFVVLTVAFVFPEAKREGFKPVVEFYDLKADAWQVLALVGAVLLIGYLLASASSTVLDTMSGRTWSLSLIGRALVEVRRAHRDRLGRAVRDDRGLEPSGEAKRRLTTRFAPPEREPAPTALGDALRAAEGAGRDRFGMSLGAVWAPMRATLGDDDPPVKIVIEEKATVDLMAGLWLALTAFAVEATLLFSVWGEPEKVLRSLTVLPFAYVAYRIAVTKTLSWTDGALNVLALRHEKLRSALGLREPTGAADRKALWGSASRFLLSGEGDPAQLFDPEPSPAAERSVRVSGPLKAAHEAAAVPVAAGAAPSRRAQTTYTLFVEPAGGADAAVSGYVSLTDARLVRILEQQPSITKHPATVGATVDVLRAPAPDEPDRLLFRVNALPRADAAVLSTTVTRWSVEVGLGLTVAVEERPSGALWVTVSNPTSADVTGATLTLFHTLDGPRTVSAQTPGRALGAGAPAGPGSRAYPVAQVDGGASFRCVFELAPPLAAPAPAAALHRALEFAPGVNVTEGDRQVSSKRLLEEHRYDDAAGRLWAAPQRTADAENNLGCAHALLGERDLALAAFERAQEAHGGADDRARAARNRARVRKAA